MAPLGGSSDGYNFMPRSLKRQSHTFDVTYARQIHAVRAPHAVPHTAGVRQPRRIRPEFQRQRDSVSFKSSPELFFQAEQDIVELPADPVVPKLAQRDLDVSLPEALQPEPRVDWPEPLFPGRRGRHQSLPVAATMGPKPELRLEAPLMEISNSVARSHSRRRSEDNYWKPKLVEIAGNATKRKSEERARKSVDLRPRPEDAADGGSRFRELSSPELAQHRQFEAEAGPSHWPLNASPVDRILPAGRSAVAPKVQPVERVPSVKRTPSGRRAPSAKRSPSVHVVRRVPSAKRSTSMKRVPSGKKTPPPEKPRLQISAPMPLMQKGQQTQKTQPVQNVQPAQKTQPVSQVQPVQEPHPMQPVPKPKPVSRSSSAQKVQPVAKSEPVKKSRSTKKSKTVEIPDEAPQVQLPWAPPAPKKPKDYIALKLPASAMDEAFFESTVTAIAAVTSKSNKEAAEQLRAAALHSRSGLLSGRPVNSKASFLRARGHPAANAPAYRPKSRHVRFAEETTPEQKKRMFSFSFITAGCKESKKARKLHKKGWMASIPPDRLAVLEEPSMLTTRY